MTRLFSPLPLPPKEVEITSSLILSLSISKVVIGKQLLSQSQPGWLEDHEEFMIKAGRQLVDVKWTKLFLNTIVHAMKNSKLKNSQ